MPVQVGLPYRIALELMPGPSAFDEMTNADGSIREPYLILDQWLKEQHPDALGLMAADAEAIFRRLGITSRSMAPMRARRSSFPST
jgi:uncharacterized circularly permuted ATP-grasp superfamily protein